MLELITRSKSSFSRRINCPIQHGRTYTRTQRQRGSPKRHGRVQAPPFAPPPLPSAAPSLYRSRRASCPCRSSRRVRTSPSPTPTPRPRTERLPNGHWWTMWHWTLTFAAVQGVARLISLPCMAMMTRAKPRLGSCATPRACPTKKFKVGSGNAADELARESQSATLSRCRAAGRYATMESAPLSTRNSGRLALDESGPSVPHARERRVPIDRAARGEGQQCRNTRSADASIAVPSFSPRHATPRHGKPRHATPSQRNTTQCKPLCRMCKSHMSKSMRYSIP
ncbi:unnamed protein product, partial [Iphiclides podalirius]